MVLFILRNFTRTEAFSFWYLINLFGFKCYDVFEQTSPEQSLTQSHFFSYGWIVLWVIKIYVEIWWNIEKNGFSFWLWRGFFFIHFIYFHQCKIQIIYMQADTGIVYLIYHTNDSVWNSFVTVFECNGWRRYSVFVAATFSIDCCSFREGWEISHVQFTMYTAIRIWF